MPHGARLGERMAVLADEIEALLDRLLPPVAGPQARLHEAMRYASMGGGKRVRPFLAAASSELFEVPRARALRVGAAIEMVHAYSLVHDDLPAMDDALTRRGRPACHRAFDEATAILAGDALMTLAFEVLADEATHPDAAVRCALVAALAKAAGAEGMCGGQMLDLEAERAEPDATAIAHLEMLKTGQIMGFCAEAGARLGGAGEAERAALAAFGRDLGLAFQIQDDLIDATGDARTAGKDLGRDQHAGKATFVGLLGVEGARAELHAQAERARARLEPFGERAGLLRELVDFVVARVH